MTTTNDGKSQKSRRLAEIFDTCRQRYLESGGDPRKSVNCSQWMTPEELKEFSDCSREVVTDEDIANYLKTHGTWRERYAATIEQMRSVK
jgi:hypothetical protein